MLFVANTKNIIKDKVKNLCSYTKIFYDAKNAKIWNVSTLLYMNIKQSEGNFALSLEQNQKIKYNYCAKAQKWRKNGSYCRSRFAKRQEN